VARAHLGRYREVAVDPVAGPTVDDLRAVIDETVGVVSLSLVAFKSGAIADLVGIQELAHRHGALVLWDLSHAAGAIPVGLTAAGADLAVGCTYKHLNGGPGAPAFLYVRRDLHDRLEQPIPGWFGHDDMFAFEAAYRPAQGIRRFATGTPPILSLRAAQAGISVTAEAGIAAIRAKGIALTELLIARFDARLAPLGIALRSPRDAARRGGHVSLAHPAGFQITQALIDRGVVPDFRAPDLIRFGVAPLYNSFAEVWDATEVLAEVVEQEQFARYPERRSGGVT
jgi:kynureninase